VEDKQSKLDAKAAEANRLLAQPLANDHGVALVFALVMMVILAVIGSSALMTSEVDLKVSGNTKVIRHAFYLADGGVEMSPKVVRRIITDRELPTDTPLLSYATADLLGEIMGFTAYDTMNPDPTPNDVNLDAHQGTINVDVSRGATMYLSGGGVEFAAGTEGVGVGGAANTAVIFDFDSTGTAGNAPNTTVSQVAARYRKVAGVAGGK
jgi:Tfp pilus assembly protein PilX